MEYCPTKKMIADKMTKPLQRELFLKFKSNNGQESFVSEDKNNRSVLEKK